MGILDNIIKGAKALNEADNKFSEYIDDKVLSIVNNLSGENSDEDIDIRDAQLDELLECLNDDDIFGDTFQEQVEEFISTYALTHDDVVVALYYGARKWLEEFGRLDNYIATEEFYTLSDEDKQLYKIGRQEANDQTINCLDRAFGVCCESEDEELFNNWLCTLWTMKAERLHWMGKNVEAVRLAIRALPYACDEDEKANAKEQITGKQEKIDYRSCSKGYGVVGLPIDKRIEMAWKNDQPYYNDSMTDAEKEEFKEFCQQIFEDDKNEILHGQSTFSNRPYHDRQFIFTVRDLDHIGGCYDETDTIQYVFPLDEMPVEISFPIGHPQPNTLYYAHPLRPYYMPFEKAQITLLYEKVQEICRLFQCLGATEITTRCLKGEKVSGSLNSSYEIDGQANYKIASVSGGMNRKMSSQESQSRKDEMSLTQTFTPTKKPYCPDDLLWAKQDPEIQTFIKQRLNGGLQTFTKRVSSYETSNISQNQIMDVKAAFGFFMNNVSANYNQANDSTFDSSNETEWEISVKFKPLNEFDSNDVTKTSAASTVTSNPSSASNSTLTENEKKYIEELEFILEDGSIGESERRFLERKRIKFGISTERAVELEASIKKSLSLTEEEHEYLELYKEYSEVGEITDRVRRLLDRELKSLGISKERANEIESSLS